MDIKLSYAIKDDITRNNKVLNVPNMPVNWAS